MTNKTENKPSVRFWCEQHKEMRTLIAGRKVKFSNHEYNTTDPVVIAGLDKLDCVERYEEAMKKKHLKLDAQTMTKLEAQVKAELKKELREEVRMELEAELRAEIEAELKKKK